MNADAKSRSWCTSCLLVQQPTTDHAADDDDTEAEPFMRHCDSLTRTGRMSYDRLDVVLDRARLRNNKRRRIQDMSTFLRKFLEVCNDFMNSVRKRTLRGTFFHQIRERLIFGDDGQARPDKLLLALRHGFRRNTTGINAEEDFLWQASRQVELAFAAINSVDVGARLNSLMDSTRRDHALESNRQKVPFNADDSSDAELYEAMCNFVLTIRRTAAELCIGMCHSIPQLLSLTVAVKHDALSKQAYARVTTCVRFQRTMLASEKFGLYQWLVSDASSEAKGTIKHASECVSRLRGGTTIASPPLTFTTNSFGQQLVGAWHSFLDMWVEVVKLKQDKQLHTPWALRPQDVMINRVGMSCAAKHYYPSDVVIALEKNMMAGLLKVYEDDMETLECYVRNRRDYFEATGVSDVYDSVTMIVTYTPPAADVEDQGRSEDEKTDKRRRVE
jgi:hypothetical protein